MIRRRQFHLLGGVVACPLSVRAAAPTLLALADEVIE